MTKYEFASAEWLAAMHATFASAAAHGVLPFTEDFTFTEVYSEAPSDISTGGSVAFTIRVRDGGRTVGFEAVASEQADLTLRVRWADYLPLVKMVAGDTAESQRTFQRAMAEAMQSGKVHVDGDITRFTAGFAIHDAMARLTA
jgi:hypothetical protein